MGLARRQGGGDAAIRVKLPNGNTLMMKKNEYMVYKLGLTLTNRKVVVQAKIRESPKVSFRAGHIGNATGVEMSNRSILLMLSSNHSSRSKRNSKNDIQGSSQIALNDSKSGIDVKGIN